MRYRYLDDFRRGISVFAIFSYGIAVLGTPQCPPPLETAKAIDLDSWSGCVAIFAIIPALATHVPSHAVTYYLLN